MHEGALLNDRYQLLERLGSGGMAEVFRARDLMLERLVAIKLLRSDYSHSQDFQDSFRQEARAAANLSHPNIVTVHDFGLADELLFIVMELVPGRDLKSLLRQHGRLGVADAMPLMIQACAGIGYAHRAGLVHCDVKPQNMLVSPDSRLKVTDFGIARALATVVPGERLSVVWGSPQYFSPEQAAGEAPTPASDVYSLGIVMYELLAGTPPFTAATAEELARMHARSEPHPIQEYVPEIPPALAAILTKVLSKEPAGRYRTADQLGRVLLKFGGVKEPSASAASVLALTPEVQAGFQQAAEQEPASSIEPALDIDWASVGLGLLAVLSVGGLVPFWMWVFFAFNPPVR